MKWILFTGTWRLTNTEVEKDVRNAVREVIEHGKGVLTGGATGVDYFAMDEALKLRPDGSALKVIIPAHLEDYFVDYYNNWCQKPVTTSTIDNLVVLLRKIKSVSPENLIEMPYHIITSEHYYLRDSEEVKVADEIYAFHVNGSPGTQDTIDKAVKAGLPITVHKRYTISE